MKKLFVVVVLIIGVLIIGKTYFSKQSEVKKMDTVEKGWHVEIINSYINVRKEANTYSSSIGKVIKGEKYEVLDINLESGKYIWYYIELNKDTKGWIASRITSPYLIDHNNPNDVAAPVLKFFDDIYYADSIEDINYEHLEIWDDKNDYIVTHEVYKEITEDNEIQYWIKYTVEDKAGKKASKTQRVIFASGPSDDKVLDFKDYKRQ